MNKTKKMLIGLMLCGAIAMAGSAVTTLRGYEGREAISVCAEEGTFTETETTVSIYGYQNNRIGFQLGASDYATANQDLLFGVLSELNTLTSITYNDKSLGESLDLTKDDKNIYLQMWTQPNTIYFPILTPQKGDVIKIAAGTQFPSSAYIKDNSVKTCYVVKDAITYTFNGTGWAASRELKKEDTSVSKVQLRGTNRILFFLSANDYASTGSTQVATSFADCNTLEKIQIYVGDTCVSLGEAFANDGDTNVYFNVWNETGSISFPLKSSTYTAATVTKVVIPAGTQFASVSGKTAYTTTKDVAFINKSPAVPDSMDWERQIIFTEEETTASVFEYINGRLGFSLSENDFPPTHDKEGNPINKNANIAVEASLLNSLNFLNKIKVNGAALGTLSDISFFNMWTRPNSFYIPIAQPEEGTVVEIPAGTQFPSYAYVSGTNDLCYTTKTDATYVLLDGEWRKTCSVTFDGGEAKTAYIGATLPADVIPATPSKDATETIAYTFDGWYVGEKKFDVEKDVVTGDMALVAKFTESARKYSVTYNKEDGTEYQTVEVANGETLTLIQVPEKLGYTGVWSGETFDKMPTKDIVYTASYTAIEYKVTFKADGQTVGTDTYTVEDKTITEPSVPEKTGYTGVWETYELTTGDVTVNAVYTAIPQEPSSEPTESGSDETSVTSENTSGSEEKDKGGCGSVASVLGVSGALALAGVVTAIRKRKENKDK